MKRTISLCPLLLVIFYVLLPLHDSNLFAASVTVTVSGKSDMWLAGMPNGSTASTIDSAPTHSPALVPLPLVPGITLTTRSTGWVNNMSASSGYTPDGNASWFTGHNAGAEHGISTVVRAPMNALMGVFLGSGRPDTSGAPAALDFSTANSRDYLSLTPGLKQVFFIGDGLTSGGAAQHIVVPDGATRLYLGTMDSYGWADNSGSFSVTVGTSTLPDSFILLSPGWNFISLPKQPRAPSVESVLGDASAQVQIVWGFDNMTKQWKKWRPGGSATNSLSDMVVGKGYWVYVSGFCYIDISGWDDVENSVVRLYDGWNLVGYNAPAKSVEKAIGSLQEKWRTMWGWDNGSWYAKQATLVNLPVSGLTDLAPNRAYWMKMTGAGESGIGWNGDEPVTISGTNPVFGGDLLITGTGTITVDVNPPKIAVAGDITIRGEILDLLQLPSDTYAILGVKLVFDDTGALSIQRGTSADSVKVLATGLFNLTAGRINITCDPSLNPACSSQPSSQNSMNPGSGVSVSDPGQTSYGTVVVGSGGVTTGGGGIVAGGTGYITIGGSIAIGNGGSITLNSTGNSSSSGITVTSGP
jgi:hypothetical protein